MQNKTKRTIAIIVFVLALCTYILTCPNIAILFPGISLIDAVDNEGDVRISFFSMVAMIVSACFFIKAIKKDAIWFFVPILLLPFLWLLIDRQAFDRTVDESEISIIRSAFVYDKRSWFVRRGANQHRINIYFYRNGEKITREKRVSRERFHQVNIGDTILIRHTVNDWQGERIFRFNPTSEEKIKGLEGFEIRR